MMKKILKYVILNVGDYNMVKNKMKKTNNELKNKIKRMKTSINKGLKKGKKKAKSKFDSNEVVILLVLTMLVSVFVTAAATTNVGLVERKESKDIESTDALDNFLNNYEFILENYFGEINEEKILNEATKSILESLGDPFSNMIDAPTSYNIHLNGKFEGVGVEIINDENGDILILNTFEGSPARRSGLYGGEIIVKIDDKEFKGVDVEKLVDYISSNEGPFDILVEKNGEISKHIVDKEEVIIPSVHMDMLTEGTKNIAHMKIDLFSLTTLDQFKGVLNRLEVEEVDELIIDLRGNSGGHLSIVEQMTELLLEEGMTTYITEDSNGMEKVIAKGGSVRSYNISFLADGATASASELMMGSLRDNLGYKIYGQTTYGKGTIQQVKETNNDELYTITIKRWLTPEKFWVNDGGLEPDYKIDINYDYYITGDIADDSLLLEVIRKITE